MKKNFCLTTFFLTSFLLFVGCSQSEKVKNNTAIDNTEISKQQVDSAFKRMWENVTLTNLAS